MCRARAWICYRTHMHKIVNNSSRRHSLDCVIYDSSLHSFIFTQVQMLSTSPPILSSCLCMVWAHRDDIIICMGFQVHIQLLCWLFLHYMTIEGSPHAQTVTFISFNHPQLVQTTIYQLTGFTLCQARDEFYYTPLFLCMHHWKTGRSLHTRLVIGKGKGNRLQGTHHTWPATMTYYYLPI